MTKYDILLSRTAVSQLNALTTDMRARIKAGVQVLGENPFQRRPGADIKRLVASTTPAFFRLRVGDYRIIYTVDRCAVKVTGIFHRGKGYKWLE